MMVIIVITLQGLQVISNAYRRQSASLFGTVDAVSRYNGRSFVNFTNVQGLQVIPY